MRVTFPKVAWLLAALAGAAALDAQAAGLSAERIATGLSHPVFATAPRDDARVFIVEIGGTIRILENGAVLDTPFLDISGEVNIHGEAGLLSLAFPPDYAQTGIFYVYYTGSSQTAASGLESRVARFSVQGDPASSNVADASSEQIIFRVDQPFSNHNGGTVAIRSGFLYLGLGDGGNADDEPFNNAQHDTTPLGKMMRLDLSIASPTTGDWTQWAKGLRNPFRYSFDRQTGDLYIGDVGQGAWEEVDVEPADSPGGRNYGWAVMEGDACFKSVSGAPPCNDPSLTLPVYVYPHPASPPPCGVAETGGSVYRGSRSPSLHGVYFFSDYCLGRIWTLTWDGDGGTVGPVDDVTGEIVPDAGTLQHLTAVSEDGAGELLFVDLDDGDVFRLVPEPTAGVLGLAALVALAALGRAR